MRDPSVEDQFDFIVCCYHTLQYMLTEEDIIRVFNAVRLLLQPCGMFAFDIFGHVAYVYCLSVLFVLFLLARRIVYSPLGLSLRAVKGNPLRAASIGISVNARLVAVYTFAAFYAGVR